MNPFFSNEEIARYSRHLILPEFNIAGQRKLKNSKVLVIGAGGLGCPMLLYLTAAGVGTIGIVDFDVVDKSNLQRQVLFTVDDVGKSKASTAANRLSKLNPEINLKIFDTKLTSENALDIIKEYDLVADGTDNFPTRYLVNDACVLLKKPNVHGSIFRFEGQVSVFNYQFNDGSTGPQYRDIFPSPPPPGLAPSCAEGGVLGVLPGIIGSFQASEIIKVLAGKGDPLVGKLFILDALTFETRTLKIRKNPNLPLVTELIDYEDFCGLSEANNTEILEMAVEELKEMIDSGKSDFQIVDVRESYEYEIGNLGGLLIPLGDIENRMDEISFSGKTVFLCRSGIRSQRAIEKLQKLGFKKLYNLRGGVLEWAEKIDNSFPKY
ncbi:MAG: molybdopterin-synthase adenylyltransferase MoeB [Cyclobacteriaceae bacterium]|nr:molybdopterin-synthase adenylyltransferase MoeB [Cyclobacteriaceae bacterium]